MISEGRDFWNGRRVTITGHTGFKGGWLAVLLTELGAEVTGIGLPAESAEGFAERVGVTTLVHSHHVDIRDREQLQQVFRAADPQVVFHLAAQSLVLPSVREPVDTFATNVVGTAAVLEACTNVSGPDVVVVATSDKVYRNDGSGRPFVEGDPLGGGDPYSASKAAAELVVESWRHTFVKGDQPRLATARAGNVIGGGDAAKERLVPDLTRSFALNEPVVLRNPSARRPWQFVLDPLAGYLLFAEHLAGASGASGPTELNFGPDDAEALTVAEVADRMIEAWGSGSWVTEPGGDSVEASLLHLDTTQAQSTLGWRSLVPIDEGLAWTAEWCRHETEGGDMAALCRVQIARYRDRAGW